MKRIVFILLLIYPAALNAQTAGIGGIFSSLGYFLFGGLILGSFEASIFRHSFDTNINIGKIILYNYVILILAYLIFIFFAIISNELFNPKIDYENVMEAFIARERNAAIKLIISIVLYFIIVVSAKYIIYNNKRIVETNGKELIPILLIPNTILLGLFFFLAFDGLAWWFSY